MTLIRIYGDPWNGALRTRHAHPGVRKGSRAAGDRDPGSPAGATGGPREHTKELRGWLEEPVAN